MTPVCDVCLKIIWSGRFCDTCKKEKGGVKKWLVAHPNYQKIWRWQNPEKVKKNKWVLYMDPYTMKTFIDKKQKTPLDILIEKEEEGLLQW
jgi:hypothetical protein